VAIYHVANLEGFARIVKCLFPPEFLAVYCYFLQFGTVVNHRSGIIGYIGGAVIVIGYCSVHYILNVANNLVILLRVNGYLLLKRVGYKIGYNGLNFIGVANGYGYLRHTYGTVYT